MVVGEFEHAFAGEPEFVFFFCGEGGDVAGVVEGEEVEGERLELVL